MTDRGKPFLDVTLGVTETAKPSEFDVSWSGENAALQRGSHPVELSPEWLWEQSNSIFHTSLADCSRQELLARMTKLGTALFHLLIRDNYSRQYNEAIEQSRHTGRRLRLHLMLPASLATAPFELLYDPNRKLFLAANDLMTLVRGTQGPSLDYPSIAYPLRMLLVSSEPEDVPALQVERELANLREKLAALEELGVWQIEQLSGPGTLQALRDHPEAGTFHVLHFIGHGLLGNERTAPVLGLTGTDGRCELVEADRLVPVLARYSQLRLVVLNACHGANAGKSHGFASLAHSLSNLEIPAVVAMSHNIADESAIVFSSEFYGRLCRRFSVDESLNFARTSLYLADDLHAVRDWPNPRLFLRSRSPSLFAIDESQLPWESRLVEFAERGAFDECLALIRKVGVFAGLTHGERQRLAHQVGFVGNHLVKRLRWSHLNELMQIADDLHLEIQEGSRWKILADNRLEFEQSLADLQREIGSSNAIKAIKSAQACQRRIDELLQLFQGEEIPADKSFYHGGDPQQWSDYWSDDLKRLNQIRRAYTGPDISPEGLRLIESLEKLLAQKAMPAEIRFEHPAELKPLFHHVVDDLSQLQAAWDAMESWFKNPAALNGVNFVTETLNLAGSNRGLLRLAMGEREEAIAHWRAELKETGSPADAKPLCRHLALAALASVEPAPANSVAPPLDSLDDSGLACWAMLLEGETVAAGNPDFEAGVLGAEPVSSRELIQWLCQIAPTTQPSDRPVEFGVDRDLVLLDPDEPQDESPFQTSLSWPDDEVPCSPRQWDFRAELGGRAAIGWLTAEPLLSWGRLGLREFGHRELFQDALRRRCLEQEPSALRVSSQESLRLRCLFSPLAKIAVAVDDNVHPSAVLELFSTVELPNAAPADRPDPFVGFTLLPESWRPAISPQLLADFEQECPAHLLWPEPSVRLAQDAAHLWSLAAVRWLWEELESPEIDSEIWTVLIDSIKALPESALLADELGQIQEEVVRRVKNGSDANHNRELLESVNKLGANESVQDALAAELLTLARKALDDGDREELYRLLGSVVDQCPGVIEVVALKCAMLKRLADDALEDGQIGLAKGNLLELIRTVEDAVEPTDPELEEYRDNALQTLADLEEPTSHPVPNETQDVKLDWSEEITQDPQLAQQLVADALQKIENHDHMAAAYDLEEASYNLSEGEVTERIVPIFLNLFGAVTDLDLLEDIVGIAKRCCGHCPRIQGEASRLKQMFG